MFAFLGPYRLWWATSLGAAFAIGMVAVIGAWLAEQQDMATAQIEAFMGPVQGGKVTADQPFKVPW